MVAASSKKIEETTGRGGQSVLFLLFVAAAVSQLVMAADQLVDLYDYFFALSLVLWLFYVLPLGVVGLVFLLAIKVAGLLDRERLTYSLLAILSWTYIAIVSGLDVYHHRLECFSLLGCSVLGIIYIVYSLLASPRPVVSLLMALIAAGAAVINLQLSPGMRFAVSSNFNVGLELAVTILLMAQIAILLSRARVRTVHLAVFNAALLSLLALTSLSRELPYAKTKIGASPAESPTAENIESRRPNIVLIVLDTMRRDHLSLYGYERNTSPFLDKFSQDAVVYNNSYSVTNWTMPAHASLFTGLFPRSHGASRYNNRLGNDQITLAEILKGLGYKCGAVSANSAWVNRPRGMTQGFDFFFNQFPMYTAFLHCDLINNFIYLLGGAESEKYLVGYLTGAYVNDIALRWVRDQKQPWFLFINYMEPHAPYYPPPKFRKMFPGARNDSIRIDNQFLDINTFHDHLVSQYDAEAYAADTCLEHLLDTIRNMSSRDDTLVVITSDHGELLGEHLLWGHFKTAFKEELETPLIIRHPGGKVSGINNDQIQINDVPLIILDYLKCGPEELGEKYSAYITELKKQRQMLAAEGVLLFEFNYQLAGKNERNGTIIIKGRDKLIVYPDGRVELFDLSDDPGELHDLSTERTRYTIELKKEHDRLWAEIPVAPNPEIMQKMDSKHRKLFEDLGYINKGK